MPSPIPRGPGSSDIEAIRRFQEQQSEAINQLIAPRNVFKGSLRANQTTSKFTHPEIKITSIVIPVALTANAQAIAAPYQSTTASGEVTFTHASNANADKTYLFAILTPANLDVRTAS